MALDGGYYGSLNHALAKFDEGRFYGKQEGQREGYEQGFSEGYNAAIQEANQRIAQLQAQYQAALDHQVMLGSMKVTFADAAGRTLRALIHEDPIQAQKVRAVFRAMYLNEVQDSLNKHYIPVAPERNAEFVQSMPGATRLIVEALQQ